MMALRTPWCLKTGAEYLAFSHVLLEFGSRIIAEAGTPDCTRRSAMVVQSSIPVTSTFGARRAE